ncbi:hypothetical protein BDN72DRAFT_112218 [Pluteus cervinus]|uniref:Uncharacterized protein n=1 Tax=Pluteus cervinus TaxID=181527 RepID=A0ACD3ANL6_9AGAR|nr:hypothetical protein BDN72DRAFT_112218 [Pluteus cervinus]
MLSLAPGSTCDVCLETFGQENKAPCSIPCGHVFCVGCLHHIGRPSCPLCRVPFTQQSVTKLHVDVESERSSSSPRSQPLSTSDQEARKLQEAITSITNEGTTEARLRQLIAECKTFLAGQPRHMYSDFRASYRMLAYLCEVKSMLRAQEQSVEDLNKEISQMTTEKGDLERAISEMESSRKEERESAATMERSLRDHATRAHAAYQTMVDCYNVVVSECFRLREDVQRLQYPKATVLPDSPPYSTGSPSNGSPTFVSKLATGLDRKGLKDAALADPNSLLISPLPQFTGGLGLTTENFSTLPDVEEEEESGDGTLGKGGPPMEEPCNAAGHPFSCHCVRFSVFSPDVSRASPAVRSPSPGPVVAGATEASVLCSSAPQSGISLSVPKDSSRQSRSRSHSYTRSESPSKIQDASSPGPSSRTNSPRHKSKKSSGKSSQHPPSPDGGASGSARQNSPPSQDPEVLRSRLHNILNTPMSISLPNFPVDHFPPTFTAREHKHTQREDIQVLPPPSSSMSSPSRPPSRSGPSPVNRSSPPQPAQQSVDCHSLSSDLAPPQPSSTPNPPTRVSSASAAAQAIANAQKAERERQRALDKEQRRQDKESRRAERDRLKAESSKNAAPLASSMPSYHHQPSLAPPTATMHPASSLWSTNMVGGGSSTTSLARSGSTHVRPGSTAPVHRGGEGISNLASAVPAHQLHSHQRYGPGPKGHVGPPSMMTSTSSARLYA